MHCTNVKLPDGTRAIVCICGRSDPKYCAFCDKRAPLLCDWKIGGGKTCDLPICAFHAEQVADDKHLCPTHSKAWTQWQAQRVREKSA